MRPIWWRKVTTGRKGFLFGVILFHGIIIHAQSGGYEEAQRLFQAGKYQQAVPHFQSLLQHYEKEPSYHYYLGRCYVHLNTEIEKAIPLLTFAGAKGKFSDTYFYLGLAYLYNYQFKEALTAFEKFPLFATRQNLRDIDIERYKSFANNAMSQTSTLVAITKAREAGTIKDRAAYLNKVISDGTFIPIPDDYKSFLWNNNAEEQPAFKIDGTLYYSSYNLRTRSQDLFEANLATRQSRLVSETLVSDADEGFAWYDADNNTLYFASKGFTSMGGYDIFKTQYNPSTNKWSPPENLGFPINTPHDETGFIYNASSGKAVVISNRAGRSNEFTAYEINTDMEQHEAPALPPSRLRDIVLFEDIPAPTRGKVSNHASGASTAKKKSGTKTTSPDDELLFTALNYQLKADSFLRQSETKRARLREPIPQSTKATLYKEIEYDEVQWKKYQQLADKHYAELNGSAPMNNSTPANNQEPRETLIMGANPFQQKKQAHKSEFSINSGNAYTTLDQIAVDEPLPDHLLYKIQLGVFSKPVEPARFGGLAPITAEYLEQQKLTKYYCGKFVSHEEAYYALKKVKGHGFGDAYIIAYYKGRKIPVSRAKELEKTL